MKRRSLMILIVVMMLLMTSVFVMVSCNINEGNDPVEKPGNEDEMHRHDMSPWVIERSPSIQQEGLVSRHCLDEHCAYTETMPLPRVSEENYEVEITSQPTCTEIGHKEYTYKGDIDIQYNIDIPLPKTPHNYTEWQIVTSATCEEQGSKTRVCQDCGEVETAPIPAMGHKIGAWFIEVEPTATTKGVLTRRCMRDSCDFKESEELPMLNDIDYDVRTITLATCNAEGEDRYYFKKDGKTFYVRVVTPKVEHRMGEWQVILPATCQKKGLEERRCQTCTYREQREIMGEHTMGEWYTVTPATCGHKGLEEHKCIHCEYREQRDTPITDHKMGEWYVTKKATCSEAGIEERKCEYCEHREHRSIPVIDHVMGSVTYDFANDGSRCTAIRRCTAPGCKYKEEVVGTIESSVVVQPTCDSMGITRYVASFNVPWATGDSHDVIDVPALGHDWSVTYEWNNDYSSCKAIGVCRHNSVHRVETNSVNVTSVIIANANCTTKGTTKYTATFNEEWAGTGVTSVQNIPTTDHRLGEWTEDRASTCTEQGSKHAICLDCGVRVDEAIPLKPHQLETTIDATGHNQKCKVCGKVIGNEAHSYDDNGNCTCGLNKFNKDYLIEKVNAEPQDMTYRIVKYIGKAQTAVIPKYIGSCEIVEIGAEAFKDNTSLTGVEFSDCKNLCIKEGAFNTCQALENLYIESVDKWCDIHCESGVANPMGRVRNLYVNYKRTHSITINRDVYANTIVGGGPLNKIFISKNVQYLDAAAIDAGGCEVYIEKSDKNHAIWDSNEIYGGTIIRDVVPYVVDNVRYLCTPDRCYIDGVVDPSQRGAIKIRPHIDTHTLGFDSWGGMDITAAAFESFGQYSHENHRFNQIVIPFVEDMKIGNNAFIGCEDNNIMLDMRELYRTNDDRPTAEENDRARRFEDKFREYGVLPRYMQVHQIRDIMVTGGMEYYIGPEENAYLSSVDTTLAQDIFVEGELRTRFGPKPVTHILAGAFNGCESVPSVLIPGTVRYIGPYEFQYCAGAEIRLEEGTTPDFDPHWDSFANNIRTHYTGNGMHNDEFNYRIEPGDGAMRSICVIIDGYRYGIPRNATIPREIEGLPVRELGPIFKGSAVESVNIPNTVTIMYHTFEDCVSLRNVTFEAKSALIVGENTFIGCGSLETIHLPGNIRCIGDRMFAECSRLREIQFNTEPKLEAIGMKAFSGCVNMNTSFPVLRSVADLAFKNCIRQEILIIRPFYGYGDIGMGAFAGCDNLTVFLDMPGDNDTRMHIEERNTTHCPVFYEYDTYPYSGAPPTRYILEDTDIGYHTELESTTYITLPTVSKPGFVLRGWARRDPYVEHYDIGTKYYYANGRNGNIVHLYPVWETPVADPFQNAQSIGMNGSRIDQIPLGETINFWVKDVVAGHEVLRLTPENGGYIMRLYDENNQLIVVDHEVYTNNEQQYWEEKYLEIEYGFAHNRVYFVTITNVGDTMMGPVTIAKFRPSNV